MQNLWTLIQVKKIQISKCKKMKKKKMKKVSEKIHMDWKKILNSFKINVKKLSDYLLNFFHQFVNNFSALLLLLCRGNGFDVYNLFVSRFLLYHEVLKFLSNWTFGWKCTCLRSFRIRKKGEKFDSIRISVLYGGNIFHNYFEINFSEFFSDFLWETPKNSSEIVSEFF